MSAGDDRIVYGMLKRVRHDQEGTNWQGAAAGAMTAARETNPAEVEASFEFWAAQAVVFALHDVADAIRSVGGAAALQENPSGEGRND